MSLSDFYKNTILFKYALKCFGKIAHSILCMEENVSGAAAGKMNKWSLTIWCK